MVMLGASSDIDLLLHELLPTGFDNLLKSDVGDTLFFRK